MTPTAQAELQTALAPGSLICLDTNCLLYYFQDWMVLQGGLNADSFVSNAMLLSALVKGSCAVIGQAQGASGAQQVHALRVLPTGRPWLNPAAPDWMRHFTNKKCEWNEPAPGDFVRRVRQLIELGVQK